jgi:hypothetical protein
MAGSDLISKYYSTKALLITWKVIEKRFITSVPGANPVKPIV